MVGKLLFALVLTVSINSVANAQVLGVGPISGGVYVMGGPPVAVPVPVPVPAPKPRRVAAPVVAVPAVPVYNSVPTPEVSNIYSPPGYPTNVPVATSPNGCAMYVDPYDLFGQLFGGADLVQSCWAPAY